MTIQCCGCGKSSEFKDTKDAWMNGWNFIDDRFNKSHPICDACEPENALQILSNKVKASSFPDIRNN